jgi:hypothetical protein
MGLGYTIDTSLKIARFRINSVISFIEDNLLEELRKFYCNKLSETYVPILKQEDDLRKFT